jgi:hypothetical protein
MFILSFDAMVPGAIVHAVTIDGLQYLAINDFIMHIKGKTSKAATKSWDRLSSDLKNDLAGSCNQFQFPGSGKKPETVISFKGAIKLAMMLSGENAATMRSTMVEILSRYYAGDSSLNDEIEFNAASTSIVSELARNALTSEGALETPKKRPRVSMEAFSNEVSAILRNMESEIVAPLRNIAAGQGEVVTILKDMNVAQEDVYNQLFKLTNELETEREITKINTKLLNDFKDELKELSNELRVRQAQIERQTSAINHLNTTIRAKDALLAKANVSSESLITIVQKLDLLLARD